MSKVITRTDAIVLEGVRALADRLDKQMGELVLVTAQIVGEDLDESNYGHSFDFVYDPNISPADLLRKLNVQVEK